MRHDPTLCFKFPVAAAAATTISSPSPRPITEPGAMGRNIPVAAASVSTVTEARPCVTCIDTEEPTIFRLDPSEVSREKFTGSHSSDLSVTKYHRFHSTNVSAL